MTMPVKAYVLLVTAIGRESEVTNEMKKIQGVKDANPVYGEYDAVVEVEVNSLDELNKVVSIIRKNPNIIRTVTLIVM
ncbi:MAG: Lrp/AsnC ligand binding domain-containing protein [Sulfolobaceae archaeon]